MADATAALLAAARRAPAGREIETIVRAYLSDAHCANAAGGCPVAALTSEIARCPRATRTLFDRMLKRHAEAFAPFMPGETPARRERKALVLFCGMAGTLNAARAASDGKLRRAILHEARAFYINAFSRA